MHARTSRPDRLAGLLGPGARFAWGTLLLLLFLPQRSLVPKVAEALLFAGLGIAAGKRINFLYFGFLALSVAAFNLLSPWGRVLAALGPLRVTEGALVAGLSKGITVTGLVFLSLFTVSADLRLPGRFGMLLGRSFYYFERLSAQRRRIRRSHVWEDIDEILENAYAGGRVASAGADGATGDNGAPGTDSAAGSDRGADGAAGLSGHAAGAWRVTASGLLLASATVALAAAALLLARGPIL